MLQRENFRSTAANLSVTCKVMDLQVFCSKVNPNCGACPLQAGCEYALSNGKKYPATSSVPPAAEQVSSSQGVRIKGWVGGCV